MLALLALVLAAPTPVAPAKTVAAACPLPAGWSEVAKRRPRFVIFGELHGTREAPALVGDTACALAARGDHILLAIEQGSTDNAALQAAWRLPDARFARALRAIDGWARDDGVGSEAMFALIVRMHALKERGARISIVAFSGIRDDAQQARFAALQGQGPHEAAQAENIADAAAAGSYDRVLVLVGNFHATTQIAGDGADRFEPMARRLARYGPTLSLQMRFAAGSMWNCAGKPGVHVPIGQPVPPDAIECAVHYTRGDADLRRAPFVGLGGFPGEPPASGYDGFFWVGPVHGSPPMQAITPPPPAAGA